MNKQCLGLELQHWGGRLGLGKQQQRKSIYWLISMCLGLGVPIISHSDPIYPGAKYSVITILQCCYKTVQYHTAARIMCARTNQCTTSYWILCVCMSINLYIMITQTEALWLHFQSVDARCNILCLFALVMCGFWERWF